MVTPPLVETVTMSGVKPHAFCRLTSLVSCGVYLMPRSASEAMVRVAEPNPCDLILLRVGLFDRVTPSPFSQLPTGTAVGHSASKLRSPVAGSSRSSSGAVPTNGARATPARAAASSRSDCPPWNPVKSVMIRCSFHLQAKGPLVVREALGPPGVNFEGDGHQPVIGDQLGYELRPDEFAGAVQ